MIRRKFLQGLPATAALCTMGRAFPPETPAEDVSTEQRCSLVFVAPDCIDGPAARILMPPQGEPPLPQSPHFKGLRFTGKQRNYLESIHCDTWYPSWAADGTLYCSCTDGTLQDSSGRQIAINSQWEGSEGWFRDLGIGSATGHIPCPRSYQYGTTGQRYADRRRSVPPERHGLGAVSARESEVRGLLSLRKLLPSGYLVLRRLLLSSLAQPAQRAHYL